MKILKMLLATFAVLIAPVAVAQPELTVDLATVAPADGKVHWVYGSTGTGAAGVPVAGGPDANGDGLPDYAVGFMQADPSGRTNAGEVDLVFGDGTITGFVDTSDASDTSILRVLGAASLETAGSEIWMDDVTGDGIGDLLICRQNFSPTGRNGAGALTILKGGPELTAFAAALAPLDLLAPSSDVTLTTLTGANQGDRLCIWLRTGDVDGDGVSDIVVAADQEDIAGEHSGAVYVVRGGAHLIPSLNTHNNFDLADFGDGALDGNIAKFYPPAGSNHFHLGATCQIADLDGNGRAEVMAGAALNRAGAQLQPPGGGAHATGGPTDGTLYIAWDDNFPTAPWTTGHSFALDAAPGSVTRINGENASVTFGEEILGGLDYDNNGVADLFVGDLVGDGTGSRPASGIGYVFYDAPNLKGLDFDLQTPPIGIGSISRQYGPISGAIAGDTVAHGDFDNDGIDDLAFSSPHGAPQGRTNAGVVHILFGEDGVQWPAVIDVASMSDLAMLRVTEIQGAKGDSSGNTGDTLSYSAAAGDIDGDGRTDFITNEMVGDGIAPGTVDVGNLIVISGAAITPPATTCTAAPDVLMLSSELLTGVSNYLAETTVMVDGATTVETHAHIGMQAGTSLSFASGFRVEHKGVLSVRINAVDCS